MRIRVGGQGECPAKLTRCRRSVKREFPGRVSRGPPNLAKLRSSKTKASARNDPGRPGERKLHDDKATVRAGLRRTRPCHATRNGNLDPTQEGTLPVTQCPLSGERDDSPALRRHRFSVLVVPVRDRRSSNGGAEGRKGRGRPDGHSSAVA